MDGLMRIELFRSPVLLAAVVLAACAATPPEVVKVFENPEAGAYSKVLVIGVTDNKGTRRGLEDKLAAELASAGVEATAGHTLTSDKIRLLKSEVNAAAEQAGADAILVTHFVSTETRATEEEGRSELVSVCRSGDPADYFLYDYDVIKVPNTLKVAHTVVAVSSLYDASNGERLWSIQSTCFDKATFDDVLDEEARVITRQLLSDGLVG